MKLLRALWLYWSTRWVPNQWSMGFQTWKNGKVLFGSHNFPFWTTVSLVIWQTGDEVYPRRCRTDATSRCETLTLVLTLPRVCGNLLESRNVSLNSEPWGCPNHMEAFTKPVSQQEGSTRLYICTAAHGERENVPFHVWVFFDRESFFLGGRESIVHIDHIIFFCVDFGLAWCMGAGAETHSLTSSVVLFVQTWCLCQNQGNKSTCKI